MTVYLGQRRILELCFLSTFLLLLITASLPVLAETPGAFEPITIAQAAPLTPSLYPTDVTPVGITREQELMTPGAKFYLFQKLPSRMWFNLSTEVSQRYESNVFLTKSHGRSDYVFRVLPNVSLGYNVLKNTSIYFNYFVLKDLFAGREKLSFPTTQSLALGLRHEATLDSKTTLQLDLQARELWQSTHLHQFDYIPGFTLTRVLTPSTIVFLNALLQMRGRYPFVAPSREIDPFYTLGIMRSYKQFVFTAVGTLVTNFRHPPFNDAIPPFSNNAIVADFEVSHPITKKIPSLVAFARAEPVWNWHDHGFPGISGYDFRFFTGLRMTIVKPSFYSQVEQLRSRLKEIAPPVPETNTAPGASPSTNAPASDTPSAPPTHSVLPAPDGAIPGASAPSTSTTPDSSAIIDSAGTLDSADAGGASFSSAPSSTAIDAHAISIDSATAQDTVVSSSVSTK